MFAGEMREKGCLMSGAAARTGEGKEKCENILNKKGMGNMVKITTNRHVIERQEYYRNSPCEYESRVYKESLY